MAEQMNKKLVLENGVVFEGFGFGADRDTIAQLVFNTSMVGYQEIVSESNYFEQLVALTYPIIGSYGVNDEDDESKNPCIGGLIVRDYNDIPSNFRYTKTLSEAMEEDGIPGIYGIDTRELTRMVRDHGHLRAMITGIATSTEDALAQIRAWSPSAEPVSRVSCPKRWYSRTPNHRYNVVAVDCGIRLSIVKDLNKLGCNVTVVPYNTPAEKIMALQPDGLFLSNGVAVDCGIRLSIVKDLNKLGCNVTVVPYNTPAEKIMALQPDGLFLSNGPGAPEQVPCVVSLIRALQGKLPILGVDLGHELICLANGAQVRKMQTGHHGSNHPIRCVDTGRIEFAEQSHNYCLDASSIEQTGLRITHFNVLDGTPEAVESTLYPTFSTQFYLNANHEIYGRFIEKMEGRKTNV